MPTRDQLLALLRSDLAALDGLSEGQMFGGLAFLLNGHLVCALRRNDGMFRVGKPNEPAALQIEGASPMTMSGRRMEGIVEASGSVLADDRRRRQLMEIALGYVRTLAPK
ncbi:TfoX/Sxy family protein [Frigidibacter sp. ROC022]|uniref:TfoX/Sxy family protein n=1 Tax=Frigidibacter sp. ROC022 TaxID=2971796 RepID=UPI00215B3806|nr:TfoX/Sxy family protein [Frigidibacter sp. ROC022]MCR8723934.1 TfoX/Sxy family protein [Frigidibacter sp. ROC022]